MEFIFTVLFWFLGIIVGGFGLIQIITVARFSIPYTKKLSAQGVLNDSHIITNSNIKTICLWLLVSGFMSYLVYHNVSELNLWAYMIGIFLSLVFGFGKTGTNESNITQYADSYKQFINLNDKDIAGTLILAEQIKKISNF